MLKEVAYYTADPFLSSAKGDISKILPTTPIQRGIRMYSDTNKLLEMAIKIFCNGLFHG